MDDDSDGGWTRILRVASRILFLSFLPSPKGQIRSATADSDFPPSSDDAASGGVLFLSLFAFADSRNSDGAEREEATVRVRYA